MAYFGNEPAKVATKVGVGVITATELADDSITTADIVADAITPTELSESATGYQVGSIGVGTAVTGTHKLVVGGTASFSGAITGDLTGNASGTSATVTGATQSSITSTANLATVGTITAGTWTSATAVIASAYLDADTAHLSEAQTFTGAKTFSANAIFTGDVAIGNGSTGLTNGQLHVKSFTSGHDGGIRIERNGEGYSELRHSGGTSEGFTVFNNVQDSPIRFFVNDGGTSASALTISGSDKSATFAGDVTIPEKLIHAGDADTYIQFQNDRITHVAGGHEFLDYSPVGADYLVLGSTADVNVQLRSGSGAINMDGGDGTIAVTGNATFASAVTINGGGECLTLNGGNATMVLVSASNDWSRIKFHPDNASSSKQWLIGAHKDSPYQFLFQNALGTTLSLDGNAHIATFAGATTFNGFMNVEKDFRAKQGMRQSLYTGWVQDDAVYSASLSDFANADHFFGMMLVQSYPDSECAIWSFNNHSTANTHTVLANTGGFEFGMAGSSTANSNDATDGKIKIWLNQQGMSGSAKIYIVNKSGSQKVIQLTPINFNN
jgi:hypothetical protein